MDSLQNNSLKNRFYNFALLLQHIIFPFSCPICHKPATYGCKKCIAKSLMPIPTVCINCGVPHTESSLCKNFIPLYALSSYNDNVRRLIIELKFHNYKPLGKLLGHFIARKFKDEINSLVPDIIVPIPNHKGTKRTFSHTEEIALGIADKLDIPVISDCIEWKPGVQHQLGKSGAEREDLTSDCFDINNKIISGKKIILLDDVYTTGSTVRAATSALESAGAFCLAILVVAKQIS